MASSTAEITIPREYFDTLVRRYSGQPQFSPEAITILTRMLFLGPGPGLYVRIRPHIAVTWPDPRPEFRVI